MANKNLAETQLLVEDKSNNDMSRGISNPDNTPNLPAAGKKKIDFKNILLSMLKENSHLQHLIMLPILVITAYMLGALLTSLVLIVTTTLYFFSENSNKKLDLYKNYRQTIEKNQEVQNCEWLNNIIRKYFVTCLPKIIEPKIADICATLEANKPSFIV